MELLPWLARPFVLVLMLFAGEPRTCMVDTGSGYTILMGAPRVTAGVRYAAPAPGAESVSLVDGTVVPVRRVTVDEIRLVNSSGAGEFVWLGYDVMVLDGPPGGVGPGARWGNASCILGADFLMSSGLIVDVRNGRLV